MARRATSLGPKTLLIFLVFVFCLFFLFFWLFFGCFFVFVFVFFEGLRVR